MNKIALPVRSLIGSVNVRIIDADQKEISGVDIAEALNNAERITSLESALSDLMDVQNGCPLPKYEAEYNAAMDRASKLLGRS